MTTSSHILLGQADQLNQAHHLSHLNSESDCGSDLALALFSGRGSADGSASVRSSSTMMGNTFGEMGGPVAGNQGFRDSSHETMMGKCLAKKMPWLLARYTQVWARAESGVSPNAQKSISNASNS